MSGDGHRSVRDANRRSPVGPALMAAVVVVLLGAAGSAPRSRRRRSPGRSGSRGARRRRGGRPAGTATPRARLAAAGADARPHGGRPRRGARHPRPPRSRDFTGIVIDPATGTVLWNRQPSARRSRPRSTKLLTGAAALLRVDPTLRWTTTVVAGPDPGLGRAGRRRRPDAVVAARRQRDRLPDAARLDDLAAAVTAAAPGSRRSSGSTSTSPATRTAAATASRRAGTPPTSPGLHHSNVPVMVDGGRRTRPRLDVPRTATPATDAAREPGARLAAAAPRRPRPSAPPRGR